MKYFTILCACACACFAASCASDSGPQNKIRNLGNQMMAESALSLSEQVEIEPPRTSQPPTNTYELDKGSKIIKSGSMEFETDALSDSKSKVDQVVASLGGYYEDEAYREYDGSYNYDLVIRLHGSQFDSLVTQLEEGIGQLKIKNLSANDVTEEYVDLKIRLDNKLAVLAQYKTILKRARTIEEILTVNEKVRRIEEEIESKKGRLRYLDDRVQYAELRLKLYQKVKVVLASGPTFGDRLGTAFMSGINGFLSFVIGVVYVWPFIVVCIGIFFSLRKLRGLRKKVVSETN